MTRRWRIGPEAKEDISEAVEWYREKGPGLERRFVQELRHSLRELRHQPRMAQREPNMPARALVRRWPLLSFPYAVVFVELPDEYRVIGVVHGKRRPRFWRSRLSSP